MTVLAHSERDLRVLRALAKRVDERDAGAFNNLGVVYFQKGLYEEAIEQFERALSIDAELDVARRNLEITYHQTGYYDRRIAELIGRLRVEEEDDGSRLELAQAYLQTGRVEEAIRQYERLLEKRPHDLEALLKLAEAEKNRGELNHARAWYERARELAADSPEVLYSLGEVLYNQGMNAEAIAHLSRAISVDPSMAEAYRLLGIIHGEMGDEAKATDFTSRATDLNPAAAKPQANLSLDRYSSAQYAERADTEPTPTRDLKEAFAHLALGIAFRARGMYDEARQEFARGRAAGEDAVLINQAEAELALLQGDAQEAVRRYDALLPALLESPKVWNERGVALHKLGRLKEAEEGYRRALSIDEGYALAWNNLGVLRAHLQDVDAAHLAFQRAIELRPELGDPRLNLGLLWLKRGEFAKSLAVHRELLAREASRAEMWNGLGSALLELGKVDEARKAFVRAVELDPNYTPARYNLSFALAHLGKHEAALRETKSALELDPYYTTPRYRLSIDLHYEGSELWAPELDAPERLKAESAKVRDFRFEPAALDRAFQELEAPDRSDRAELSPRESLEAARDYLASGLYERARDEAVRAVRAGADPADGALVIGEAFRQRGVYGEALERFREARALRPMDARALAGMTQCLLQLGRLDEARVSAEELQPIAGQNVWYLLTVGDVLTRLGDAKRAMEVLDVAVQLHPDDPMVQRLVARAALVGGNRRRAKNAYRTAIALDPDYAAARVELGQILIEEGAEEEAEREIRRALELVPTYNEATIVLAQLLERTGRTREVINVMAELLEVEPYNLGALVMLGRALAQEGRRGDAERAYHRVLHFDPDRAEVLFELGELASESGRYRQALAYWRRLIEVAPGSEFAARAKAQARDALGNGRGKKDVAAGSGV